MVIRGIAVKNYPDPMGEEGGVQSVGKRVAHAGGWGGRGGPGAGEATAIDHESVYRFFRRAPCGYL